MARCAIIEVGTVVNIVEADEHFAAANGWIKAPDAAIGDLWDGEKFTKAVVVVDLEALRAAKEAEIDAERERRNFDSFEHAGKVILCDRLRRSDIDGANGFIALNGVFPEGWPGAWKCADNSLLPITTLDEWKALYGAMVAAGNTLYLRADTLKAQLAKATTAEQIAAVVW